ncbi:hypothetical protein [Massilia phyllosphaerae]|uniref:hypothetical protein n=1 Tax=Massilia phyllosphaerae TaxID=3106034 RepID=UPI002B1CB71C|nr:hypothetical protein [Massilia sp. SGZ-792]
MPKFQVSYTVEGDAALRTVHFDHPSDEIESFDLVRRVAEHANPKKYKEDGELFPPDRHTTIDDVFKKYKISSLKKPRVADNSQD